jgi:hypothetical protein
MATTVGCPDQTRQLRQAFDAFPANVQEQLCDALKCVVDALKKFDDAVQTKCEDVKKNARLTYACSSNFSGKENMISFIIVGLALVPISAAAGIRTKPGPGTEESLVVRSVKSFAAVGLAASYCCAIMALKAWAKVRPHRTAD